MALNKHTAPDGYMYTDGTVYAKTVILSALDSIDNYKLVPEQEYYDIMAANDKVLSETENSAALDETLYELLDEVI